MRISKRLKTLAEQVQPGRVVVDVGTDHAYLPIYLILKGISPRVIGVEINPGPLRSAQQQVEVVGLTHQIEIRFGDGLGGIQPGEAQVAVVAGMGGNTICDLLGASPKVLARLHRLILQPMGAMRRVREWLWQHGWQIVHEDLVKEDQIFYSIIIAEPSRQEKEKGAADRYKSSTSGEKFSEVELEIGPLLLRAQHPLLSEYLHGQIAHKEKITAQLQQSHDPAAVAKLKEYTGQIKELKGLVFSLERKQKLE